MNFIQGPRIFLLKFHRDHTPHPKWWFRSRKPLILGKSRLVKYYNLTRYLDILHVHICVSIFVSFSFPPAMLPAIPSPSLVVLRKGGPYLALESIHTVDGRNLANHLGCIKPCTQWGKLPASTAWTFKGVPIKP